MAKEILKQFTIDDNIVDINCDGTIVFFNGIQLNIKTFTRDNKQIKVCYFTKKMYYIHRLVARGWLKNPYKYKWIGFITADTTNTYYGNLKWQKHR